MEHSIILPEAVDARVGPRGSMENLSQAEISKLLDSSAQGLYPLFRSCALAVLNAGSESDDPQGLFERYRDFTVQIVRHARHVPAGRLEQAGDGLRLGRVGDRHPGTAPWRGWPRARRVGIDVGQDRVHRRSDQAACG